MEPVEETQQVKSMKLSFHNRSNNYNDDVVFNQRDIPFNVNAADILEIHHTGSDAPRLLIQVKQLPKENNVQKDVISISSVIGKKFELHPSKEVLVNIVKANDVAADLVEILFKDMYFSRSDMWRMRRSLIGSSVYQSQAIEFTDMRATIDEIWCKGDRMACAAITGETRLVFRSSTAQVNIFIQMSREMFEFDRYGELIWEKTVDGFLVDLFDIWKENSCSHDVTITLFSRQFYKARSIHDFPRAMQKCIQVDYIGRYYEDFYRVVVQNERYDDWTQPIKTLRRHFNEYNDYVLHFHDSDWESTYVWNCEPGSSPSWNPAAAQGNVPNKKQLSHPDLQARNLTRNLSGELSRTKRTPQAYNSSAAEGNVLEVLNMALNVFEKYYIDRGFDRTGKLSIVITPGQGIFDVDRELTNITKQRTIDCGCSSDLVCMGERPLHAVPLFKFHNRVRSDVSPDVGDDYNIPHWINYSFYVSRVQQYMQHKGIFVPDANLFQSIRKHRDKESNETDNAIQSHEEENYIVVPRSSKRNSHAPLHPAATDVPYSYYDNYDSKVYKLPSHVDFFIPNTGRGNLDEFGYSHRTVRDIQARILDDSEQDVTWNTSSTALDVELNEGTGQRQVQRSGSTPPRLDSQSAPSSDFPLLTGRPPTVGGGNAAYYMECQRQVGSAGSSSAGQWRSGSSGKKLRRRHRALINPFAPSRLYFQATSSRRRWAHAFPVASPISRTMRKPRRGLLGSSHEHLFSSVTPGVGKIESRRRHVRNLSDGSDILSRSIGSYRSTDGAALMMEHHESRVRSHQYASGGGGKNETSPISCGSMHAKSRPISLAVSPQVVVTDQNDILGGQQSYGRDGETLKSRMEDRSKSHVTNRGVSSRIRGRDDIPWYFRDLGESFGCGGGTSWFSSCRNEDKYIPKCPTGIDWKSMAVPASLPLTTDYFPDSNGIARDYVLNVDVLTPDDLYLGMVLQEGRKQLNARQVFNSMMHQRLAQGFQLVVLPPPPTTSAAPMSSISSNMLSPTSPSQPLNLDQPNTSSQPIPGDSRSTPLMIYNKFGEPRTTELPKTIILPKPRLLPVRKPVVSKGGGMKSQSLVSAHNTACIVDSLPSSEEVILSVGRIFQKIEICDGKITVTRYQPRHPYPQQTYHYKYRFQVPDSLTYDLSWTDFSYEKLENYNWNYVDQYLCTRGEGDFDLKESLKYWRARFFLIPSQNPATKQIVDETSQYCDIYEDYTTAERFHLIDGCLKFLESANKLNKVKRPAAASSSSSSGLAASGATASSKPALAKKDGTLAGGRRMSNPSIALSVTSTDTSGSVPSSAGIALGGAEPKKGVVLTSSDIPVSQHLLPPTMIRVGTPPVGKTESTKKSIIVNTSQGFLPPSALLSTESPARDIVEAMLDPTDGVSFLRNSPGLPPLCTPCFLSGEAVQWAVHNIVGCDTAPDAIRLFSRLVSDGFICHASGDARIGFVYGFYLYCLCFELDENLRLTDGSKLVKIQYNPAFEREWCEVAFVTDYAESSYSPFDADLSRLYCPYDVESCVDITEDATDQEIKKLFRRSLMSKYKLVHVESDPQRKSDCEEWGTARYHRRYSSTAAFELTVEWLVATGMILGELVYSWARRAITFGFHFLPVPCDPFALPFTRNSDPLRGPIFVPLNISCLMERDGQRDPFDEFSEETRGERLAIFEEMVLKRFGFIRDACPVRRSLCVAGQEESPPQYVHSTGTIFVMFLTAAATMHGNGRKRSESIAGQTAASAAAATLQQQHRDYMAHQCNQQTSCGGEPVSGRKSVPCRHVGFLWVWNYMMTKRWRSSNTGYEAFQDRMLSDFKQFCSNSEGRLKNFWDSLRKRSSTCPFDKGSGIIDEAMPDSSLETSSALANSQTSLTENNPQTKDLAIDSSKYKITITEA